MDGIIINDKVYKLVEDSEDFNCEDCALEKYCYNFPESICISAFTHEECHFEKVEKSSAENNKQSEVLNQTYFY